MKESVNLMMARREEKKDEERNTERVHWQITLVICDSGVIKERLHEEENYLSLCARHLDTKRHTVTFVTHGGGGKERLTWDAEKHYLKKNKSKCTALTLRVK